MWRWCAMHEHRYVHGYEPAEAIRLQDQARTLSALLHAGTSYPGGASVLEAGCGVGAQTVALVRNSPGAVMTCLDISESSLVEARRRMESLGIADVRFLQGDVADPPFPDESFDHVFVCFLLEHLPRPPAALAKLFGSLRPGGSITVIEGDHGPIVFHPQDEAAREAILCQAALQRAAGGDPMIGRRLYPLLHNAGFHEIRVAPRMMYVDGSAPDLARDFTHRTFTAMIAGVREAAVAAGLASASRFDEGIRALERTAGPDGVFCYTFFKAVAVKPPGPSA